MTAELPFLYIASLRRTGSTVVSEALTLLPHCFIFREPLLARNQFTARPTDAALLGVDLMGLAARFPPRGAPQTPTALEAFKNELLPQLRGVVAQVGVKEIWHDNWRAYKELFPAMRVVLTGRDPRDVYISLCERARSGKGAWSGPLTPEAVAADLTGQFLKQLEMHAELPSLKVRYEDFCTDPGVYETLKEFTMCTIPKIGNVGAFNASNPNRRDEYAQHGDEITARRVNRWKDEKDPELAAQARQMIELMPQYCAFWQYEADGS
jgi:hypothetical protein